MPLQRPAAARSVAADSFFQGCRAALKAVLAFAVVFIISVSSAPKPAQALCGDDCLCEVAFHGILRGPTPGMMLFEYAATRAFIDLQFRMHRTEGPRPFWKIWMWNYNIGNALMNWTNDLTSIGMMQVASFGMNVDSDHVADTMTIFATLTADAHRDYQPDVGMCTIGTAARSLALNSRRGEFTAHTIVENQIDRLTNSRNSSAASGPADDKNARIAQMKRRFCDAKDAGGVMGNAVCNPVTPVEGRNRDVDFNTTVMAPLTINVDYTDPYPTGPEEDVMGLSANLYAHHVFPPFPNQLLSNDRGRSYMMDQRAIAAKRSVATYSFGSIVGMKSAGSTTSVVHAPYLRAVLEQLGVPAGETTSYLGERPSYYAQMELLTKKIFQQPTFYTNLYERPTNVERKGAAIHAIRMIQDMDKFNSVLRSEQNLSVLLELYIEDLQIDEINAMGRTGE